MTEGKLTLLLTQYQTETGKDPEVIFLNCQDYEALGRALYPFGPATIRRGFNRYAGLRIQVMNGGKAFVGPEPRILTVLENEKNYQLQAVTRCMARGVKFLPPNLPDGPIHRAILHFSVSELYDGERAAGVEVHPVNVFDIFRRITFGQKNVLPHEGPFTRLVGWVVENNLTLVGFEEGDMLGLCYPPIHLQTEPPLVLKESGDAV